ncbi:MAG: KH domain-containing protein [Candidatus Pacearchaeota archaeon]
MAEAEQEQTEGKKREVVVPGEVVVSGEDYLPGAGTRKRGDDIVSVRFGLSEEEDKLVKVIPLSGGYNPRRGNVVIGRISMVTFNGWVVDIGNSENAENAFLSINEVPKFINQGELKSFMGIGDMIVAKISSTRGKGIDLTTKGKGLGKIDEGVVFKINSHRVPRVIGREGSMIKLIKERTGCFVSMGQNGFVSVKGDSIENEILARKAINYVASKAYIEGLTEEVEKFFKDHGIEGEVNSASKDSEEEVPEEGSEE